MKHLSYLTRALCLYPILTLAFIYVAWFAAWLTLGHRPISSVDDPKFIQGEHMWLYLPCIEIAAFLAYYGIWLFLGGVVVALTLCSPGQKPEAVKSRITECLIAVALYVGLLVFAFQWDPHGVCNWFMD